MLELLGTAIGSIVGGGMTGILGVAVQRIADYKNKQLDIQINLQKNAHELQLRKVDAEIMQQEWAARTKVAEVEGAARVEVADSVAFAASFNEPSLYSAGVKPSQGQAWLLVILDFVRGMVRPSLTLYLCAVTTLIYLHSKKLMYLHGSAMSPEQAISHVNLVVGTVLYLTTTCVLWWFGTRNRGKAPTLQ